VDLIKANQPRFQATDSDKKAMWQVFARILPAGLVPLLGYAAIAYIGLSEFSAAYLSFTQAGYGQQYRVDFEGRCIEMSRIGIKTLRIQIPARDW
jgi:hypothetical protein